MKFWFVVVWSVAAGIQNDCAGESKSEFSLRKLEQLNNS